MTGEARCLVRIGLEFMSLNELQRAFEAFTEALHMFERLEDDNGISICYENLGDTYMKMGEIRQAIFSYDRSECFFFSFLSCMSCMHMLVCMMLLMVHR